jgi:glycosyltransferase involved in cell wall biosynthesis
MRMIVELSKRLAIKGHHVTIVMPSGGVVEYPLQVPLIRTNHSLLQPEDIPSGDVLISTYYNLAHIVQQASNQGKGKHVRLSMCYEPLFLNRQDLSFPSYHLTNKLIVLSTYQRDLLALNHGIKAAITPVGVSSAFKNLNIRQSNPILQITAILRKPEGDDAWHRQQDDLIKQLNYVKSVCPDIEINFICPPNEFYNSEYLLTLRDLGKYRFYTPANDEELAYHYNQADIFVSSSLHDTAALPGLEAMKCGAALAAIYSGGNTDYCKHEYNCLLSYRYENKLADEIIQLIRNEALRKKLAVNGEKEASRWSWERSADTFEAALIQFANG